MSVIEIKNLRKSYGKTKVLKGIDLKIQSGEIVSIVGPSGTGKSTLLRLISRLENFDSGQILINGKDSLRTHRSPEVGMVFQNFNLFPHLSVLENIILAPRKILRISKKQAKKEAEVLLKKVGLLDKIDEYPKRLSGGQQQRIAIVRALAMHPKILLFDEPVSALDPEMIEDIVKIIQELSREITIIIVTHEISFAKNISHRMIFMDGGKILADDAPDEVINQTANPRIQAFFH